MKPQFEAFIHDLQDRICSGLEAADGKARFRQDTWDRPGGGGGRTRVITGGLVLEKGGVNVSTVHGELPKPLQQHFGVQAAWFHACGLSLVIHPENPHVPTVHANWRYFELYDNPERTRAIDCWFGGGADLTPYYLYPEDAVHFHCTLADACAPHGADLYPRYKKACDEYFYNHHRGEGRGVGGLFFDYLRPAPGHTAAQWYDFVTSTANVFLDAYVPIMMRRKAMTSTEAQRFWQELRRGRYVEFNLIHDRGTLFGLKTHGRTESILMSLPPRVRWEYDHVPGTGTPEAHLVEVLRQPVDWLG
ncbi:MAG: oxygen-dependent coproporphyrinogen oxidase [Bacteroidetes bacterium]|nr:oxygen-dependent coproporphyrinogen oxidase [Bacteroidota bacterium]